MPSAYPTAVQNHGEADTARTPGVVDWPPPPFPEREGRVHSVGIEG